MNNSEMHENACYIYAFIGKTSLTNKTIMRTS